MAGDLKECEFEVEASSEEDCDFLLLVFSDYKLTRVRVDVMHDEARSEALITLDANRFDLVTVLSSSEVVLKGSEEIYLYDC